MAPKQQLTGPDKAAILVMILGEEVAGSLFQFLDDREIKKINQAMDKAIAMILGTKDKFLGIKQAISGKKQPPCTGTPEQIVACEVDRIFAHEVEKMKKASAKIIAMDKQRKILSAKHVRNIREAVERVLLHAYKYAQLVTAFLAYPELEASAKKTICATYGIVLELAEYQFTVTDAKLQWKGTKAMIYEAELKNNPTLSKLGLEKTFVPSLLARVKDLKPLEAVDTQDLPYVFIADHSINVQYTLVYNTARFFNGQFQCGQ